MPYTIVLKEERDRQFALKQVYLAKIGMQVRISKPLRTAEQNARLHAMLTDIAKQLTWPPTPRNGDPDDHGETHDVEFWKRACTLTWLHEINQHPEIITSLDGSQIGILIPHTSDLDTEQCASLTEWITAFGATNGVVFTDPKEGPPVPEDYYR